MLKFNKNKLYCFSPEIMIATFVIEISLAIYALIQSIKHKSDLGIVVILVFLAIFQLSEYQICEGTSALLWARVGLFFITFLPVAGLYLLSRLNKKTLLLKLGVVVSVLFATFFSLFPGGVGDATCGGNYVIFNMHSMAGSLYGYYYFGLLLLGIWVALRGIQESHQLKVKKTLGWFIIGYLSFILPLTIVYILFPVTKIAIASIMCGFAIVFAFILTFKVAPVYHEHVKLNHRKKEPKA